jgi:hypothetical protein
MVLLRQHGPSTGLELNDYYEFAASRGLFEVAATDSPRKRAGELAKDGLLTITNPDDPRGTPAIYTLKEQDA